MFDEITSFRILLLGLLDFMPFLFLVSLETNASRLKYSHG